MADIAAHLGLSGERARQLRVRLFMELTSFLQRMNLECECPYDCFDDNIADTVNNAEGTRFNANFIRFIFGNAYSLLTMVGNAEDSLTMKMRGGTNDAFVAAVPKNLADDIDLNSFLTRIETLNSQKRADVLYESLPKGSPEARVLAAKLAFLRYGWGVENDRLVLPPNADKNRSEIMEDIIRDAGRPLSIEEIAEEYSRRYPDREAEKSRIQGNMHGNPRIVPIGRTGVYSLADWTEGSARGGTIRSFVRECLDRSDNHIVPSKEVFEYVRRFRPSSSDENILSNLMLEAGKSFRLIWKDKIPYLTYSSVELPEGYRLFSRTYSGRRSFQESIDLIDGFISSHGRMPKVRTDPEEERLARFLLKIRGQRRMGTLTEEEESELARLESRLGGGAVQLELF